MGCRLSLLYRIALAVAAGLLFPCVAFGQASNSSDEAVRRSQIEQNRQLQRERTIEQTQERVRQSSTPSVSVDDGIAAEDALSTTLPDEAPCFVVDHLRVEVPESLPVSVRLVGASRLPQDPFRFAQDYLDRFTGACIGRKGINTIVRRLGAQILARGYTTTRIAVPQQDLSGGTLRLALIPGVIREIRFADASLRGSWKSAFPARAGDVLNIRALEQGLEQLKRVPSQDVDMESP